MAERIVVETSHGSVKCIVVGLGLILAGNDHGVERGPPLSRQPKTVGSAAGRGPCREWQGVSDWVANATTSPQQKDQSAEGKIMRHHWNGAPNFHPTDPTSFFLGRWLRVKI